MLSDEFPELGVLSPATLGGNACALVLRVDDVEAAFQRALDAGATVERPLADGPGGRGGWLRDPFGHRWHLLQAAAPPTGRRGRCTPPVTRWSCCSRAPWT